VFAPLDELCQGFRVWQAGELLGPARRSLSAAAAAWAVKHLESVENLLGGPGRVDGRETLSRRCTVIAVGADIERGVSDRAARLRGRLVRELSRSGDVCSGRVADAIGEVPRELFVSDIAASRGLEVVYRNEALAAKTDARGRWLSSSSQPSIMAIMLEQLELELGHRVLEIGAGTGYNAALLRHIVGPGGHVATIEIDPQLARRARSALQHAGYAARVLVGDGREGSLPGAV
jgi:protein-L-isoaspartate O-methyltransferase